MRKQIFVLFLFLCVISQAIGQSDASSYKAEGWPGSSKFAAVRNYDDFLKRERALAGNRIKVSQIGSVTYDKIAYPILALSYTPQEEPLLKVLLVGGQHGNEPATPDATLAFFKLLGLNPADYKNISVDAVPMMNPWGWTRNIRYSGGGYDTNRDFALFVTGEATSVRDFTKGKSYDLVIDHHEASRDGAFIYSYNDADYDLSNRLMKYLAKQGYAVANVTRNGSSSDETGVLHIPGRNFSYSRDNSVPDITGNSLFPFSSNRMVLPRYFGAGDPGVHNFTMETSTYKVFADRIQAHVEVMKFIIGELRNR
jgi:hypothetical protein